MGTSLASGSLPLHEVTVAKSTILVLGNEGHGVRTNVARACDVQVRIENGPFSSSSSSSTTTVGVPAAAAAAALEAQDGGVEGSAGLDGEGGEGEGAMAVDSLNVSVTGGILMHFLLQQQRK